MMTDTRIGSLRAMAHLPDGVVQAAVVLLHGYDMTPEQLAPMAVAMRAPAALYLLQGPVSTPSGRHAWWPVDEQRRNASLANGPRDLREENPPELHERSRDLCTSVAAVRERHPAASIVLAGFSQGGMLICNAVLRQVVRADALALMSTCCVGFRELLGCASSLDGVPALISHGIDDPDVAFSAGENMRDFLAERGASVKWLPYAGKHEIPFTVWRALRNMIQDLGARSMPVRKMR